MQVNIFLNYKLNKTNYYETDTQNKTARLSIAVQKHHIT